MSKGKSAELVRWVEEHAANFIGDAEFLALREALAPVSEDYLRTLLRKSGVPLAATVEGVRQGTFHELEESLARFTEDYAQFNRPRQTALRRLAIKAKDHARLAARSKYATPEKKAEKIEMILWLTTWLENPPLFPEWVKIRRRAAQFGIVHEPPPGKS
ncbi:MAG: hypothetical protein ABL967_12635 [Bryobacteraceae bacterium]